MPYLRKVSTPLGILNVKVYRDDEGSYYFRIGKGKIKRIFSKRKVIK